MEDNKERIVLKIAHVSDLHISNHRNLLLPMIGAINKEDLDLVVVTGDVVNDGTKELLKTALDGFNNIRHKVVVIPGDYDGNDGWESYFGNSKFNSINLNGYCIDLIDTSFMRHRFSIGWADIIKDEDPEQYDWLMSQLKIDKYHIIFSHHPMWIAPRKECGEFSFDNIRANYAGHVHEPFRFYVKYDKPRKHFTHGFVTVPIKFHGNSCYSIIVVKDNDEIINIPRMVTTKKTAW